MLEALSLPFFQRGLIEILILAIPAGLIGSWVVLRGLAFFSHAIGTAAFPGLVVADGAGFSPALGAFGAAGIFAAVTALLNRSRRSSTDSVTAVVLVGCLALGVILASDVFGSSAGVDNLLFGSLLSIGSADIWLACGAAALSVVATTLLGPRWLARGFDDSAERSGSGAAWLDGALLLSVAVTVTASLNAVGALLVSVLIVVPAATVRLFARRITPQLAGSVLLVAVQGTFGLWLSFQTDAPPGATIAVVSGATFVLGLAVRALRRDRARSLALAALLISGGIIAGCGNSDPGGEKLSVVATTTQVGDFVATIGGDQVEVSTILQPNTDPHDYEPRPSDVRSIANAQLVFRSGGHLDEWVDDLVADSGSSAAVVDLSANLPVELEGSEHEHAHEESHDEGSVHEEHVHGEEGHEHGEIDPHWWLDPVNVEAATGKIASELSGADRVQAGYFEKRATAFEQQIKGINREIAKCLSTVPVDERKIVTDHDAFGYFTNRFGIETVGTVIPALTTQAQPSAGDLSDLEETIREEKVKAVFPESSLSPALAEAVSRDTGASTKYSLYGDSLGPKGSEAETWLEMMKVNADNLMLGMTGGQIDCFGTGG